MNVPDTGPLFTAYLSGDPEAARTVETMADAEREAQRNDPPMPVILSDSEIRSMRKIMERKARTLRAGRYERRGWREIRPGDVIKDPRGNRVVRHADRWGYALAADASHPYSWMSNWPKVGRLKVVITD